MTGFEPATPATRTRCATKLRYIPIFMILTQNLRFVRCFPLLGRYSTFLVGRVPLTKTIIKIVSVFEIYSAEFCFPILSRIHTNIKYKFSLYSFKKIKYCKYFGRYTKVFILCSVYLFKG